MTPMRSRLVAVLGLLCLAATATAPGPAAAQGLSCAERDVVIGRLAETFGERFGGGGLQDSSSVFEVWVSEASGTWTILRTSADGTTCIMAAGTDWEESLGASYLGIAS
jgi:hypothetical protein